VLPKFELSVEASDKLSSVHAYRSVHGKSELLTVEPNGLLHMHRLQEDGTSYIRSDFWHVQLPLAQAAANSEAPQQNWAGVCSIQNTVYIIGGASGVTLWRATVQQQSAGEVSAPMAL